MAGTALGMDTWTQLSSAPPRRTTVAPTAQKAHREGNTTEATKNKCKRTCTPPRGVISTPPSPRRACWRSPSAVTRMQPFRTLVCPASVWRPPRRMSVRPLSSSRRLRRTRICLAPRIPTRLTTVEGFRDQSTKGVMLSPLAPKLPGFKSKDLQIGYFHNFSSFDKRKINNNLWQNKKILIFELVKIPYQSWLIVNIVSFYN